MNKKNRSNKKIMIASVLVMILISLSVFSVLIPKTYSYELSSFESYDRLFDFLQEQGSIQHHYYNYDGTGRLIMEAPTAMNEASIGGDSSAKTIDYSETNIQVQGVDEPDSVKTDGTYIYILSDETIYIVKAYPDMQMMSSSPEISTIDLSNEYWYSSFFVKDDYLVVFGQSTPPYRYYDEPVILEETATKKDTSVEDEGENEEVGNNTAIIPPKPGNWSVSQMSLFVYDITDRNQPTKEKTIELDGNFVTARLIDSTVYVVASESTYDIYRVHNGNDYYQIPRITVDGNCHNISADHIYYVDEPDEATSLTHVLTLRLDQLTYTEKSFLIGNTQEVYMSKDNIYLVYTSYEYTESLLGGLRYDNSKQITKIHKINVNNDEINYVSNTNVNGRLLNQFSMDEHNDYFRIATTTGYIWSSEQASQNNVYILDDKLSVVSSITDIASGEEIYAARFMGDKAYLVTFKNTDPFFTLDLSDPFNPEVLGELKLPGYSDYLHPYDEHHIIGVGKDTVASGNPNFAWYQGVKLALFDVSDFDNPILVDTAIIGDRGSTSPVLHDHKAFLFDKEKQLLTIPVSVYEISEKQKAYEDDPGTYGEFQYQGAYVFNISTDGFSYQDRITHLSEETLQSLQNHSWYRNTDDDFIYRSLYIEDILYTISKNHVQAHQLSTLELVGEAILE